MLGFRVLHVSWCLYPPIFHRRVAPETFSRSIEFGPRSDTRAVLWKDNAPRHLRRLERADRHLRTQLELHTSEWLVRQEFSDSHRSLRSPFVSAVITANCRRQLLPGVEPKSSYCTCKPLFRATDGQGAKPLNVSSHYLFRFSVVAALDCCLITPMFT